MQKFLLALAILLTACKPFKITDLASSSKYQGTYSGRTSDTLSQVAISAEITSKKRNEINVKITGGAEFELTVIQDHGLSVHSAIFANDYRFKDVRENCYLTYEDVSKPEIDSAELCFNENDGLLTFNASTEGGIRKISIVLSLDKNLGLPVFEKPRVYTIDELRKRVLTQGFENRIEFEKLKQARLIAQNAQLNLLPHVGLSFGLNFVGSTTFSPMSLVNSAGNLVPFLFPANWFELKQKKLSARAEELTQIIVRADAMNMVESLALAYRRDKNLESMITDYLKMVDDIKAHIELKEALGLMPRGSSDLLKINSNAVKDTLNATTAVLEDDLRALSVASGFHSDEAVSGVDFVNSTFDRPSIFSDREKFKSAVFANSPEVKQFDELVRISRLSKNARYWNWFDLSADQTGLIGAGLPAYIKIGKSSYEELLVEKEKFYSLLTMRSDLTYDDYEEMSVSYGIMAEQEALQKTRLERLLTQFQLGTAISALDLSLAIQDRFKAQMIAANVYYTMQVAQLKIQRLLMIGHYSNAPTKP